MVSIVVPVYRNARTLRELHARLVRSLGEQVFEIVFVNDACPLASLDVLHAIARQDARVVVVSLARNSGQNRAVLEGLKRARGSVFVIMDADLQDPPEAVPRLLAALSVQGDGVVFAGRRGAYQSISRMLSGHVFRILRRLMLRRLPADAGLFVALDRAVVDEVCGYDSRAPYVVGMIGRTGARMTSIPVVRAQSTEPSSYSDVARLRLAWHALTGMRRIS
jgi:glycosyltransferase involved in cell wall biosynthesis